MFRLIKIFRADESGAITVDWVVLSAAVVGLAVLISTAMQDNAVGSADNLADYMRDWKFE